MKKILFTLSLVWLSWAGMAQQIPSLQKKGKSTCLMVDGKPFVMLSGELHNSTASSVSYLKQDRTFERLARMNLNSVIATASWELVEPVEGKFNFSEVDAVLADARKNKLKVVFIWFGAFKNPFMTYAPSWVKQNPKRFPRAVDEQGKELELPSVFGEAVMKADAKAYMAFLSHLKQVDTEHTVVMIQVENEPGLRGSKRDYSDLAQKAWNAPVPVELIDYLQKNKATLKPDLAKAWQSNGYRTNGNWEEVFGKSLTQDDGSNPILNLTEHLFTACSYAKYLNYLSSEGKKVYPLPTFINASVFGTNSRGVSLGNGCSIGDFFDVYKACAPSIDILTPNSYMLQLDQICEQYSWNGNPILIPESTLSGARALYAIGEWDAICFSPFGIDSADKNPVNSKEVKLFSDTYRVLGNMNELIAQNLGTDKMRGVYLYNGKDTASITMGDYVIRFFQKKSFDIGALMAPATGPNNKKADIPADPPFQEAALIIQTDKDEFYLVGYGINADISMRPDKKHRYVGYDSIYEGTFLDNRFVAGRLLNGDERNISIAKDAVGVLKVKVYHY